jgi:hypothetical protein
MNNIVKGIRQVYIANVKNYIGMALVLQAFFLPTLGCTQQYSGLSLKIKGFIHI